MKKLLLGVLVMAIGAMTWRTLRSDAPNPKLLYDRFWVDHEPRDPKETFQVLFVGSEHPFGHFAKRTMWTGQWEGFHYHVAPREEGVLDLLFGATQERQRVRYTARRCSEQGFDFCLELTGTSRGVRRYYSKKEWQVRVDDIDTTAKLLAPAASAN
jgi:hypothetical protein